MLFAARRVGVAPEEAQHERHRRAERRPRRLLIAAGGVAGVTGDGCDGSWDFELLPLRARRPAQSEGANFSTSSSFQRR